MDSYTERIVWHPVKTRPLNDKERAHYVKLGRRDSVIPSHTFACKMPNWEQEEILVATKDGVRAGVCTIEGGVGSLFYFLDGGSWDDVLAWAEMPKNKPENETERDEALNTDWLDFAFNKSWFYIVTEGHGTEPPLVVRSIYVRDNDRFLYRGGGWKALRLKAYSSYGALYLINYDDVGKTVFYTKAAGAQKDRPCTARSVLNL